MRRDLLDLPVLLLGAARALVDGIDAGVRARGFTDVRPAHGFAFALLSAGGATTMELAQHLDVTKQAASQMVEELVTKGYVERRPHPGDARARLVVLTEQGLGLHPGRRRGGRGIPPAVGGRARPGPPDRLRADLARLATPGRLRPSGSNDGRGPAFSCARSGAR